MVNSVFLTLTQCSESVYLANSLENSSQSVATKVGIALGMAPGQAAKAAYTFLSRISQKGKARGLSPFCDIRFLKNGKK